MSEEEEYLIVEVLDKNFHVLFRGSDARAVNWICDHPVPPHVVYLEGEGFNDLMTIDAYLREWDELEYL